MAFGKVTLTGASETLKAGWTKFNSLIDDLLSTTAGKGASQIGITDAGLYMSSANVEDALQEIYADTSTARTLSGTFEEDASTTTGLTWGYTAGTVRFDNTVTVVAAGTISLTDDATNYIEIQSDGTVSRNTTGFTSGRIPIRTVVCASGVQTTSTDKRSWFQSWDMPLPVAKGGTGAATLTDHGILLGSGTSAVTPLGAASNGQIPIGSTGADPVLATIAGTANQITSTAGAGTITLSIPDTAAITFSNTGLHLLDTDASHDLIIKPGSDLTADRTLTITTGDSDRTIAISGDVTISPFAATLLDDADAPTARATLLISCVRDTARGLVVRNNATHADHQMDINADEITLQNSSHVALALFDVDLTIDLTASGANGLDTGTVTDDTHYHYFVIYNGSTTAGLASLSATDPALPEGYTYLAYVCSNLYVASTGNKIYYQRDKRAYIVPHGIAMGTNTSPTSVDLSAVIPETARTIIGTVRFEDASSTSTDGYLLPSSSGPGGLYFIQKGASGDQMFEVPFKLELLTAQTIYYQAGSGTTMQGFISGWEY